MRRLWRAVVVWIVAVLALSIIAPLPVLAQGRDETTTLVPFINPVSGIKGVAPRGWGLYDGQNFAPGDPLAGPSLEVALIQQAAAGLNQEALSARLLPVLGIEELPPAAGSYRSDVFTWTLYSLEVTLPQLGRRVMDGALAQDEAGAYFVALLTEPGWSDRDRLYETVFRPALAAFAPLTAEERAALAPAEPEYWPTEGWRTATPESQGMDSARLAEMVTFIEDEDLAIDSVLVVRHGYLVLDAYFYPFAQNSTHELYSVTKSFTSALVGIAIEEGYLAGIDQPVVSFFPERTFDHLDADKAAMTIENLLTMTAGLDWQEMNVGYGTTRNTTIEMAQYGGDWTQFVLDRPMAEPPGTVFNYNSGASYLLSAILTEATGMRAADFARERLFEPLGFSRWRWTANPRGVTIGGWGLNVTAHDMAKFGLLYLHQGRWDDQTIVPADWVAASTTTQVELAWGEGYGYQWWISPAAGTYSARGLYGQYIIVIPALDMVVTFISDLPEEQGDVPDLLLAYYVLPAVQSLLPLPEDPDGLAGLEAAVESAGSR